MPAHLPDEDTWRFPPAPVSREWRLAALLAPLLAVAIAVAAALTVVDSRGADARGYLDDPEVTSTVAAACAIMTASVQGQRVQGPARLQAAVLADQNLAVREMIQMVREVDPTTRRADRPLEAWLTDWEALLRARERYARQVGGGFDGSFRLPTDPDGRPVTERIDRAADGFCVVPEVLVDPYSADDVEV